MRYQVLCTVMQIQVSNKSKTVSDWGRRGGEGPGYLEHMIIFDKPREAIFNLKEKKMIFP